MKKFATLFLFALTLGLQAQITYKASDGPKPGTKIESADLLDISGFDLQDFVQPGGNQQWDISGPDGEDYTTAYISVNDLPFKSLFPGSNMASVSVPNDDSSYTMMEAGSAGLYIHGLYSPGMPIVFNNKMTLVKYPLQFGDNFQNDVTANFDAGGFPAQVNYMTNATAEAWGTMKTNEGSFACLKLKTIQLVEISILGVPFGSQTITTHSWLASGKAEPVADLSFVEFEDNTGIIQDTSISYLKDQEIVATRDEIKISTGIRIAPNPASTYAIVQLAEGSYLEAEYFLIDAHGKSVRTGRSQSGQPIRIELEGLPTGNYLVLVTLDNERSLFDIVNKI
ncbi:MAG: T9SS type A sorting domain-containing protein [Saprospiraceae bacterium]|nr:T9SS type A sorting domain-containing protein [Saprospiraceae bacterium]